MWDNDYANVVLPRCVTVHEVCKWFAVVSYQHSIVLSETRVPYLFELIHVSYSMAAKLTAPIANPSDIYADEVLKCIRDTLKKKSGEICKCKIDCLISCVHVNCGGCDRTSTSEFSIVTRLYVCAEVYERHMRGSRADRELVRSFAKLLLPGWHFSDRIPKTWTFWKWFGMKKWCLTCTS